jgi:hydrogenase expression/formation protein HypE
VTVAPFLPTGKLSPDLLAECLALCPTSGPGVLLGPGAGEDAAVIDPGPGVVVAKTDPVTFATDRLGWYAVHVAANDVATRGADPQWLLLTLLLPEGSVTRDDALAVFRQVGEACREVDATLVGGHTEVTCGLARPLACASLLGMAPVGSWLRSSDARAGDAVLLVGGCAIEGTALLAREFAPRLRASGVEESTLSRAAAFLDDPGISVLAPARLVRGLPGVRAMHDPTEGGVLCGLSEVAAAAGCSVRFRPEHVRIADETRLLCSCLGLDPLRLIASGALLVACDAGAAGSVRSTLARGGFTATEVGRLVVGPPEVVDDATGQPYKASTRDELARLLESPGH